MGLSCECDFDYNEWYYSVPQDFSCSLNHQPCASCGKWIQAGMVVLEFERTDCCDENGDDITLPPWYMCEECGEIFLNLDDLGYCIVLGSDNMHELLDEYHEMTGFKKDDANN